MMKRWSGKVKLCGLLPLLILTSFGIRASHDLGNVSFYMVCFIYFLSSVYVGWGYEGTLRSQKRMSDALELRVKGGCETLRMGAGRGTWVLCMSGKCPELPSPLSSSFSCMQRS